MYSLLRPFLFRLEPEQAHSLTIQLMHLVGRVTPIQSLLRSMYAAPLKPVRAFGLEFPNPLGLAAGYDKDGLSWRGMAALGFGHIEIGTVTPRPQPGNPQPRLFRLIPENALINRMGFPGKGGRFVARRLGGPRPPGLILGVNIGKNKETELQDAAQDYTILLRLLGPLADYLAINVSSPNTAGLRRLQDRDALSELLEALRRERKALQDQNPGMHLPLLVKLAPDLESQELDDALDVILSSGMDGVIATNTTLNRGNLDSPLAHEPGGLSGSPLFMRSLRFVRQVSLRTGGRLPVIGAGGIDNAAKTQAMLDAGASLVQLYTGLIYQGPSLPASIITRI